MILGNLIIVPIEDTLLYVQPLYLVGEQTQLPQLKRVIVFYRMPSEGGASGGSEGDAEQIVVMAPTLAEALADAFGVAPPIGPPGTGGTGGGTGTGMAEERDGDRRGTGAGLNARALELIQQANSQFEAAQAAQQAGDWAEYGRQVEALQETLRQLQDLQ